MYAVFESMRVGFWIAARGKNHWPNIFVYRHFGDCVIVAYDTCWCTKIGSWESLGKIKDMMV